MIRINLLGGPKPKRGKRGSVSMPGGDGPNPMLLIALIVIAGVIGNGWYYWKMNSDAARIAKSMGEAQAENTRLARVKQQYLEAQKQEAFFKKRSEEIDKLKKSQTGPVDLLTKVSDTVNKTDAVWLISMKEDGNNVNIDGTALSANAVANLIANLRDSKYFKSVEIKETFQDNAIKDMQAFQFTLICEKQAKS
jgi:Tfp pilus assembly protein PilN